MLSITGDPGNTTIMRCHYIPSRMATLKRLTVSRVRMQRNWNSPTSGGKVNSFDKQMVS